MWVILSVCVCVGSCGSDWAYLIAVEVYLLWTCYKVGSGYCLRSFNSTLTHPLHHSMSLLNFLSIICIIVSPLSLSLTHTHTHTQSQFCKSPSWHLFTSHSWSTNWSYISILDSHVRWSLQEHREYLCRQELDWQQQSVDKHDKPCTSTSTDHGLISRQRATSSNADPWRLLLQ